MKITTQALVLLGLVSVDATSAATTLSLRGSDLVSSALLTQDEKDDTDHLSVLQHQASLFEDWQRQFEKTYQTAGEMAHRFAVWRENHRYIEQHNHNAQKQTSSSFQLGHNAYSDLTTDEFQAYFKLGSHSPADKKHHRPKHLPQQQQQQASKDRKKNNVPDRVDWVDVLPPVKNQGMCGSCWAFSAIGAIEGAHYLDTGKLVSLSEQQFVDCDKTDMGCGGGLMDNAFAFDEYNMTGICSEDDYPYAGHRHWFTGCHITRGLCEPVEHTRVKNFTDVNNTETALVEALTIQPVSIGIQADLQSFRFYKSGIYEDPQCGNKLDHGVLAVGYGVHDETGKPYFKVRNSWGATWGDDGYILMLRGDEAIAQNVNGTCGLLGFASRPALKEDGTPTAAAVAN